MAGATSQPLPLQTLKCSPSQPLSLHSVPWVRSRDSGSFWTKDTSVPSGLGSWNVPTPALLRAARVGGLRKEELGLLNRLCVFSLQDCTFFNKNDILK